ncbi:MAG TPA: hypothetical protein PKW29_05900, partial [Clostridia bacterium]|nr:hypothetical protein [Clostridia bacterium]
MKCFLIYIFVIMFCAAGCGRPLGKICTPSPENYNSAQPSILENSGKKEKRIVEALRTPVLREDFV